MPSAELVIFDCDGVLIDSEIVAARAEAELITAAGYPIEAEELAQRFAGLTLKDMMLAIEKEAAVPLKASLIEEAERQVDRRLAREARAIEGAEAAIRAVRGKKCICSNSAPERLAMMLEKTRLAGHFENAVFSARASPSGAPKPAPDVFLHAAAAMAVDPARCFVIEDSVHGISGAKAAGMRVIGFTGASHSYPGHADLLTEAGAETVISRLSEFGAVLAALAEWSEAE